MMMRLLLLTTTMATLFGVVVAESSTIRGNYLRQKHGDRILKKVDWEKFAEEIQANQEEDKEEDEEIDWNAFAADLVSAGVITTTQPTVDSTTAKPSTSPTQVRFSSSGKYYSCCLHMSSHIYERLLQFLFASFT